MIRLSIRWTAPVVLLLAGAIVVGLAPPPATAQASEDDAAIRSLWSALDASWNARDADRFSRLFSEDVSFVFVDRGQSLESRSVVREHYAQRLPGLSPDLRHLTRVSRIRPIAPGNAAVDGTVEILKSGPDRDSAPAVLRTFAIFAVMADGEDGWQIRMLRIHQQAEAADPAATNHAPVRRERDGQHDFDFEIGSWKTQLSRLVNPLTGSTKWVEHEGTSVVRKVWNGRANLVELDVEGIAGRIEGLSLRLYDPESRQWSLSFANSRSGTMTEPVIGEFRDGRGEFYGRETLNGRAIFVRFIIAPIGTDAWRFEQAFSDDGGKTWEVNWIAIDTRVTHDCGESP